MDKERLKELKKTANIFLKGKTQVFIKTFIGNFYTGYVVDVSPKDYFLFKDKFKNRIPIVYSELKKFEIRKEELKNG